MGGDGFAPDAQGRRPAYRRATTCGPEGVGVAAAPPSDEGRCIGCGGFAPHDHEPGCPYVRSAAEASDAMTGVAAPLLAGFTISLVTLVVQGSENFRWSSTCALAFSLAAVLLVTTVQAGFWLRYYRPATDPEAASTGYQTAGQYVFWNRVARHTYDAGIFLLLAGLAGVLAPIDDGDVLRWVAAGVAALAALAELVWAFYAQRLAPRLTGGR